MARDIVIEYGMSEALGPISFGSGHEAIFLGREIVERRSFSEEIAAKIDKEVLNLIQEASKTAQRIIKEKREVLERIATYLLEKETIEEAELKELLVEA